jgi:hypothetical protein
MRNRLAAMAYSMLNNAWEELQKRERVMLAKYNVEYSIRFNRDSPSYHYYTDDPVACVEFLLELLERNLQIQTIRHEGQKLPRVEFDRIIKTAAGMLASKAICTALNISADEERYRFGFTA